MTDQMNFAAYAAVLELLREALNPAALDRLQAELQRLEQAAVDGAILREVATPYGRILFGGSGANRYDGVDTLAIFDLGGDDEYRFASAAAELGNRPLQVIVDFAGDDLYVAAEVGGHAAGLLGVSVLVDQAGNDRYSTTGIARGCRRSLTRGRNRERPCCQRTWKAWTPG